MKTSEVKKILIITGAGSSCELDIESGLQLIRRIAGDIVYGGDLVNQFFGCHFFQNRIEDWQKRKYFSENIAPFKQELIDWANQGNIIDSFLQNPAKEKFKPFGQFAIAYYMIGAEDWIMRQSLYGIKHNWLKIFLEKHLVHRIEDIQKGKVKVEIITFNYERIIEHHVYNYLRHNTVHRLEGQNGNTDAARDFVKALNILHVYGKIADLEWQESTRHFKPIRFGAPNDNPEHTGVVLNQIKIIGERIGSDIASKIQNVVRGADKIYILGFGYDTTNMKILFGNNLELLSDSGKMIIGTAYKNFDRITLEFPQISVHDKTCWELVSDELIFNLN